MPSYTEKTHRHPAQGGSQRSTAPRTTAISFPASVPQRYQGLGNQDRMRLSRRAVQTKLSIGAPGDIYEQEADRVADEVVRRQASFPGQGGMMPAAGFAPLAVQRMVQRQESSFPDDAEKKLEEQGSIQRKSDTPAVAAPVSLESQLQSASSAGQPLPPQVQARMEASFGASFAGVRIHNNSQAAQLSRSLNAEAFTYGNDIFFGANKLSYGTRGGTHLLAHELTHTLQQNGIQRKSIQCRGGTTVGNLSVKSNVVSAGLTAGHAWLSYTPVGGTETTYGTWGNRTPIGLHRDLEVGRPAAATRTTALDATDYGALTSFAAANSDWGYINNCASFAGRGWNTVTGESVSYRNMLGIPNPSSLGAGITAANGGTASGTLVYTAPTGTGSSSF